MRTRSVACPPPCGARAFRADTRRASASIPRIVRIRLYHCDLGHEFETAETIVGEVRKARRHDKQLIYTHSVRRDYEACRSERDYQT